MGRSLTSWARGLGVRAGSITLAAVASDQRHSGTSGVKDRSVAVRVRRFVRGRVTLSRATLVVGPEGFLVKTPTSRLLLPSAGGLEDVSELSVACYEHPLRGADCHFAAQVSGHRPRRGWAFRAAYASDATLSFAVRSPGAARELLALSDHAPGPGTVATWASPWIAFWRSCARIWLFGTLLVFGFGAWDAEHLQEIAADVTASYQASMSHDQELHLCDLAGEAADGTPISIQGVSCGPSNEVGSKMQVGWSSLRGDSAMEVESLAIESALGRPLLWSGMLGVVAVGLGCVLALAYRPRAAALDRTRAQRASAASSAGGPVPLPVGMGVSALPGSR